MWFLSKIPSFAAIKPTYNMRIFKVNGQALMTYRNWIEHNQNPRTDLGDSKPAWLTTSSVRIVHDIIEHKEICLKLQFRTFYESDSKVNDAHYKKIKLFCVVIKRTHSIHHPRALARNTSSWVRSFPSFSNLQLSITDKPLFNLPANHSSLFSMNVIHEKSDQQNCCKFQVNAIFSPPGTLQSNICQKVKENPYQ